MARRTSLSGDRAYHTGCVPYPAAGGRRSEFTGDRITSHWTQAIDAVVNPAPGGIVCRSTLTSPNNGCVPLTNGLPPAASAAATRSEQAPH